jgi:iron complex outermembrane receptor protein
MTFCKPTGSSVFVRLALALAFVMGPPAALAQFDEIIVTSRKVEESLQDVPLSITAFTRDTIQRAGLVDLNDIALFTPGLSFFNPIGDFLPTPIIRGCAQTDIFGEPNVGTFIDGVYIAGREGLNFNFLDVERIEVVKGPQSTLYGRNTFCGAINYISKKAPEEFQVDAVAQAGSDDRIMGRIQVGGPIFSESLRGYLAAGYDDFDGTYEDNLGGNDVGGREFKTVIGKLEWYASDSLDISSLVYYSDDEVDISAITSLPMNCENIADPATATSERNAAFCGRIPDLDSLNDRLVAAGYPNAGGDDTINKVRGDLGEDRDLLRANLNIDWDTSIGTFTFLTGYSDTEQEAVDDGSRNLGNRQPFEYCPGGQFACVGFIGVEIARTGLLQPAGKDETEEWSQEIRFTTPQDRSLRGGGGFYYFDSELKSNSRGSLITTTGFPPNYTPGVSGFGPFVLSGAIPIGTGAFESWFSPRGDTDSTAFSGETDIESWASFGFLEVDLLDERLTLRVEARYTYQEEDTQQISLDFDPATGQEINRVVQEGDGDWDFWTGRFSVQYRPSDDWMLYGTVANGKKSGFIEFVEGDLVTGDPFALTLPVDEEENISYELGAKGTFADGRVQFDVSGFYTDWSDAAIRATFEEDPATGIRLEQPEAVTQIAGEASIWGWDSSLAMALGESWLIEGGISYQDAQWDDAKLESLRLFEAFGNGDQSCRVDFAAGEVAPDYCGRIDGNQVARQPPWQGRLSVTYTRALGLNLLNESWEIFGRGDFTYEDDWYPQDDNLARIPSHTYVNGRIGLTSDRYSLEFWVRNLFEEQDASASFRDVFFGNTDDIYSERTPGNDPNQFFPFRYSVSYPQLRTWGVTVRARFGGD